MKFIADLHLHSRYSRATSPEMDLPNIAKWAKLKGIKLLGSGDFTHPLWLAELKRKLAGPNESGLFEYENIYFTLSCEISSIYSRRGRTHRVHNVVVMPDFDCVDKLNSILSRYGNLDADGRATVNIDCEDMVNMVMSISGRSLIFPAHAWTPHFSVFGSNSGFDSLEECYGKETGNVCALETGLSSDPPMNWRISGLDRVTLLSFSDAHSPKKLGREATIFDMPLSYDNLIEAVRGKDPKRIRGTLEYFPEEGKYHYDGHRNCQVRIHPKDAMSNDNKCPYCNKRLTIGVLHRVEDLADRGPEEKPAVAIPCHHLVPLEEIIADALVMQKTSRTVERTYLDIIGKTGTEIDILLNVEEDILRKALPQKIADGVLAVRAGQVDIDPGYDGVYGTVNIKRPAAIKEHNSQMSLFQ